MYYQSKPKIHIVVANNYDLVRAGFCCILSKESDIEVLAQVSLKETPEAVEKFKPDLLLIDLEISNSEELKLVSSILKIQPDLKIIAMTRFLEEAMFYSNFKNKAQGFLTKDTNHKELIIAIHRVFSGSSYISRSISKKLAARKNNKAVTYSFDLLSERELQIMLMLINDAPVQSISKKMEIHIKTIKSYRCRAFEKLDVRNDVQLVLVAARQGLLDFFPHKT